MVFQTERNLKEYGDKIPADKRSAIEAACADLKKAVDEKNIDAIDSANAALEAAWHAASEEMSRAAQGGPQGGPQGPQDFQGGPQGGPTGPQPDYGNNGPDEQ